MEKKELNTAKTILQMQKLYKEVIKSFWKGYNGLCEQYEQMGEKLTMPVVYEGVDVEFIFNGRKYTVNTYCSIPTCEGSFSFEETMENRAVECFLKKECKLMRFYE